MMSKVAINPKTATLALRSLALGTSCSLVLISEERRRRLDIARTLVDNGRLIKSQRCYNTSQVAAVRAQLEKTSDTPFVEADFVLDKPFYGINAVLEREGARPSRPAARRKVQMPRFPGIQKGSEVGLAETVMFRKMPSSDSKKRAVADTAQSLTAEPTNEHDTTEMGELEIFERDYKKYESLQELPQSFLESTSSLLLDLQQRDDLATAQLVVDRLCHHPSIDHRHFDRVRPEFLLRCILSDRAGYGHLSRPGRRFRIAVFLFWLRHQLVTMAQDPYPEAKDALLRLMAEQFARDNAEDDIQSFLATSHVQFGRHMTSKLLVVEVAKLYREQGETALLDRWLDLADRAGVPIRACHNGRALMKGWEIEDSPVEEPRRGSSIPGLKRELRYPLESELARLDQGQRELFDRMDEKAGKAEWQGVLDCYSEGRRGGVKMSGACLRLAVEAAVELEGIHSTNALKLIEEAHAASVQTDPVIQSLLIARFNAIGKHQGENRTAATRGYAYKAMRALLDEVKHFYEKPSEVVYNRAIRVCLRVAELRETRDLCLQLAREYWNGDALYMVYNFASLVTVAARSKDYSLLQRLLEALPWRSYQSHPICKTALRDARMCIRSSASQAATAEERLRHEDALGYVEIAYQNVLRVRITKHRRFRTNIKEKAFGELTPVR